MERLYGEHSGSAFRFDYRLTGDAEPAEDLVQDAFVRLIGRFGSLSAPMKSAGSNMVTPRLRRSSRRSDLVNRSPTGAPWLIRPPRTGPDADLLDDESGSEIVKGIYRLSHRASRIRHRAADSLRTNGARE